MAVDPLTSSRYAFTAGNPSTRGEWDGHGTIGIQTGQVDPSWLKSHNYYKSDPAQYQRSVQAQTRWGQTTTRMVQTRQLPQMPVPKPDPAKAADAGSAALNWLKGAAGDAKSFLQDNFTCGQFVNAGDSQCSQRFSSVREPINNGLQAFDETSVALGPLAPELLGLSRGIGFFATGRSLLAPVGEGTAAATSSAARRTAASIDDALSGATVVRGRFARTAEPGAIHVRRDPVTGAPTHYQTYGADGLPAKRVDLTGRAHGGVPTPHVVEFERHTNPGTGEVFTRPNRYVRPANPDEIPGG